MQVALDAPTARGVAERLMHGALDMYSCPENPNGCLGVISSVACGAEAECIREAVLERGPAATRAMLDRFPRAKEEDDFAPAQSPEGLDAFLQSGRPMMREGGGTVGWREGGAGA